MRFFTLSKTIVFTLVTTLFTNSFIAMAQPATKDLNKLHDPMIKAAGYIPPDDDATTASVITIGDYDNFKLGVDFAECSITVNPLNPLEMYAVWNTTGTAGGKGYRTTNGFDWATSNPSWTGMAGDVVVTSDSAGRLIYENMYGGASIQGCKVAVSQNFGQTWDPVVTAISGVDKNWIAADQTGGAYSNYIYTVMTANSGGNHARSINNGTSFSNTQNMSTQSLPGMMVAVGPKDAQSGGATYVVTNSGSSFSSTYTFYESNDGGQTYTFKSSQNFSNYVGSNVGGRNSVQNMRTRPYPFIAVDNSNGAHRGRLYLVYASNFPAGNGNKPDIFCRYSDNGGTTWSSAKTVNDDANSAQNNNWFPALWSDKNTGRLYISWMDTRDCPTSDSALIYATYTDDGETFATNQMISNKKMKINCSTCGGGGSPMYLGDYNGIGSNGKTAIIAWTDFRDNNFGSYVSYFPDYGLRTEPAVDTLDPVAEFKVKIPSVKLFADTVLVTATVTAAPGQFTITYPEGNKIWSFPGEIPVQVTTTSAPTGDYTLTITATGTNGTPVHKRTVNMHVMPLVAPTANFTASSTTVCVNQPVSFTDHSTGPPSSWQWNFPGATPSSSTVQNPANILYTEPGTYGVSLTVTNAMGTSSVTYDDYITVNPAPVAPIANGVSVCSGQPVPDLIAEGTNLKWYFEGNAIGEGTNLSTGQSLPGVYHYFVSQYANGCESAQTPVDLVIWDLPVLSFGILDTLCASVPAFELTNASPSGGTYSGDGVLAGNILNPGLAGAGDHQITYTYTDQNGCSNHISGHLTIKPIPVVTLNAVPALCVNALPYKLSGEPAGGTFSGTGVTGDSIYPQIAGVGEVTVTYTYLDNVTNCPAGSSQLVVIHALPDVSIADSSVCGNHKLFYDVTIQNPSTYEWMPSGATTAVIQLDTIGKGLGSQTISVKVKDANGCIKTDTAEVNFYDCTGIDETPESRLIELYPNPANGEFALRSSSIEAGEYTLLIYNTLGNKVYQEKIVIGNLLFHHVNLQHVTEGVYVLRLSNKNKEYTKRLVIKK